MRKILLADKQEITRIGLESLVSQDQDGGESFIAGNKVDLIRLLGIYPDSLIILDYTLFDLGSFNELYILSERYNESSWILFSDELSDSFLRQLAVNNLPYTIVFKTSTLEEIRQAIGSALRYEVYRSQAIKAHLKMLLNTYENVESRNLTITEKEILKEIALGKTTKEVAANRNLSFHTVMTHRKNIFRKLEVKTVHEAIKYAMKAGVVDSSEYYI
jgi:Response regulator containing a CheY-like receiver domain and an HTH DNA-binding domain